MPATSDFTATGRVLSVSDSNQVVFSPTDTTYRLHLAANDPTFAAHIGQVIPSEIHATARKIFTIASGGGFIAPIFGTPKVVQGRVVYVDQTTVVVRASTLIVIELPPTSDAIDLAHGAIIVGSMINAVLLPGASIRPVTG